MKHKIISSVALTALGVFGTIQVATAQLVIPPSLAAPAGTVDTSKPGFKVRVFDVNTGLQVNHVDIAEGLVRGTRIDPATGEPYVNASSDPGPLDVLTVINYDGNLGPTSTAAGNFRNDEFFPGVPQSSDDFVLEVTGFIELPAGNHRLGVNSDDGFKLTIGVGPNPLDLGALRVSGVDTTRGQANTDTAINIATAGFYPFRLLYWERGGDARLEFSNFTPGTTSGGTRYLVNDSAQANAFKTYRELLTPFNKPYARLIDPAIGSTVAPPSPYVRVELQEQDLTVDLTIAPEILVDDVSYPTTATRSGSIVTIAAQVPLTTPFAPGSQHTARLRYTTSAGEAIETPWQFTVQNYASIPTAMQVASVDTSKPGFKARTYQMPHPRYPGNRGHAANAERALSLGYNDPTTGLPYSNTADMSSAGPDGYIVQDTVVNWNDGTAGGNFGGDTPIPGLPTGGDFFVTEALTFLDLKGGAVRLGVNSDDGFRLLAGHDAGGIILGEFDAPRGATDSLVDFVVPADGLYPVRLMFNDIAGGGGVEFFSVDMATGERTLINDSSVATSIKAYRESTVSRPYVSRLLPAQNYLYTHADQDVIIDITDGAIPVNAGSVTLKINGEDSPVTTSKSGNVTSVRRDSSVSNLLPSGVNNAELSYTITEDGTAVPVTVNWSYTVPPYTRVIPAGNKVPIEQVSGNGMLAWSHQIDRSGDGNQGNGGRYTGQGGGGNNMPRPEIQISEGYISRSTGQPYPNLAQAGFMAEDAWWLGAMNFNSTAAGTANTGIYNGDTAVPGLPGTGSSQGGRDNFVQEVHGYLDLKAGAHIFAINLDDGFVMSSAPNPRDTLGTLLGMRNPGGGNANPLSAANAYAGVFNVIVPEDGIYPIRLLWWQGGGGVNIEFMTIDPNTGMETLVNDIGGNGTLSQNPPPVFLPQGVVSYSDFTGPARPWVKFSVYPISSLWQNQHQQSGPGPIRVVVPNGNPADIANDSPAIRPFGDAIGAVIADLGEGAVGMILDGEVVTPTVMDIEGSTDKLVIYKPATPLDPAVPHTAGLIYAGTTNYWTFNVITYVDVPASVALPSDAAQTRGFRAKVVQASAARPGGNTVAAAELQLTGTPADVSLPGAEPDGTHIIEGIINWNVQRSPGGNNSEIGNFQTATDGNADSPVPGIPGTDLVGNPRFENITAEIFAWLDLPAGYQKFAIGADDGFKVQIGLPGQTDGPILYTTDRGAGPRDIPFAFVTPQAGLYPVRIVWYQGGGGGNIELFTYGPDNQKIPVNSDDPNAVKAYYVVTGGPDPVIEITSATISGGNITIVWEGGGTLEWNTTVVGGTWTSTGDSDGSFTEAVSGEARVYRVRQ